MKPSHFTLILSALALLFPGSGTATVEAQTPKSTVSQSQSSRVQTVQRRRRLNWRVGVRPTRYRIGGFSRSGSCASTAKLMAFVPPARSEERVNTFRTTVDPTLSSRPTFWVYVSSIPENTELEFTLQDAVGNQELYNTRFVVNGQTGLLGVRLPDTAPELAIGENYFWEIAMRCDPEGGSTNLISTSSWVQRVDPNQIKTTSAFDPKPLVRELARASNLDKPSIYANLGIWQDAVTALIDLQQKQPNNKELREDWRNLLTGAQMTEFIDVPVLDMN